MLMKAILDWIEEKSDAIKMDDKLWGLKAFALGGLEGMIDFFAALGIFIWVIMVFANLFGKKESEQEAE